MCIVGFLTGALQNHARKYGFPVDHLSFKYNVLPVYRDQMEVAEAMAKQQFGEEIEPDQRLTSPSDGVLVHGLFMDGFRWDGDMHALADALPGVMNSSLPVLHMEPVMDYEPEESDYQAPLYKTAARAGVLSTTGQSINYSLSIHLFKFLLCNGCKFIPLSSGVERGCGPHRVE